MKNQSKNIELGSVPDDPIIDSSVRLKMPVASNVTLGQDVVILYPDLVNLYGCEIGDGTRVGPFVEIQRGAFIGRLCKIQSHSFICEAVTIEDEVFIGHGVMFVNDKYPRAAKEGRLQTDADWRPLPIVVERGATIGSGAVILGGVRVGAKALVGAGAVVTRDVPPGAVVVGVPSRVTGQAPDIGRTGD